MLTNSLENDGYSIRMDAEDYEVLSTFTNVRNLSPEAWGTATTLKIKSYKSKVTAIKTGEKFLKENN